MNEHYLIFFQIFSLWLLFKPINLWKFSSFKGKVLICHYSRTNCIEFYTFKLVRAKTLFTLICTSCASSRMSHRLTCVRVCWCNWERREISWLLCLSQNETLQKFSPDSIQATKIFSVFQRIFYFSVPSFIKFNHSFREV